MTSVRVLLEVDAGQPRASALFGHLAGSRADALSEAARLLHSVAGPEVELDNDVTPVPMFSRPGMGPPVAALRELGSTDHHTDLESLTTVVGARVDQAGLEHLAGRDDVTVWSDSSLSLYQTVADCAPFEPPTDIDTVRDLLGVAAAFDDGFCGQGVVVAVMDEGVDGTTYPVTGGSSRAGSQAPGTAPVTSHGSMCAADVLIAAPDASIYDYPFIGDPHSGGALAMFQAVLEQRRIDGTPQVTTNSWGFAAVPPREQNPGHEIWDRDHPLHRKVREVVASGAVTFFAAGNCGADCPSDVCHASGIGPGRSIHAANSLAAILTIAAVNRLGQRLGYSSQGPGMFVPDKPDLAGYSHLLGNFGPGRPGGQDVAPFDGGTSAATPLAAGVAALLLSASPGLRPGQVRAALVDGARGTGDGWDPGLGRGIIDAGASYRLVRQRTGGGA